MTFIQSTPRALVLYRFVIAFFAVLLAYGAFVLIMAYNRTVEMKAEMIRADAGIQRAETEGAELKEKMIALLGGGHLREAASRSGLVEEKNPRYFEVTTPWDELASR